MSLRKLYLQHVGQTSEMPLLLEVDHAKGIYITDRNGKVYMDLNSGISVSSTGHAHPKIIAAITSQTEKHLHTMVYGEHVLSSQVALAQKITQQTDSLDTIYYLLTGTEVVEAAMKLAKKRTNRVEVIAAENAYHGSTQGSESLRSDENYKQAFYPLLPGISWIKFNDFSSLDKITAKTAAVIIEPVQAEAGVILPQNNFLLEAQKRCRENGALFILDEIQTGFGRTGKMFAFQKMGLQPDLVCLGKAMGGGLPLSALLGSKEIIAELAKNPALGHISTFGGHPLSCAAGNASLEIIMQENLMDQIEAKEALFHKKLKHPIIKEVRSAGLMMAVEVTKRKYLKHVVTKALELGVIVDYFLFNSTSFRLAPPLIISTEEIERACSILVEAMEFALAQYT